MPAVPWPDPVVAAAIRAEYRRRRAPLAVTARERLGWQYALGLPLDDGGFDHTVLNEFRGRVAAHGLEEAVLDALLARLAAESLVKAGWKQRTDSTHVIRPPPSPDVGAPAVSAA